MPRFQNIKEIEHKMKSVANQCLTIKYNLLHQTETNSEENHENKYRSSWLNVLVINNESLQQGMRFSWAFWESIKYLT